MQLSNLQLSYNETQQSIKRGRRASRLARRAPAGSHQPAVAGGGKEPLRDRAEALPLSQARDPVCRDRPGGSAGSPSARAALAY